MLRKNMVIPSPREECLWKFPQNALFLGCSEGQVVAPISGGDLPSTDFSSYDLVVFRKSVSGGHQDECSTSIKAALEKGGWCVWIHTGDNARPSDDEWRQFFRERGWISYAFLLNERKDKWDLEWYSVDSRASPQVNGLLRRLREAVGKAVQDATAFSMPQCDDGSGIILPAFELAITISGREQEFARLTAVLEYLFPLYLDGATKDKIVPEALAALDKFAGRKNQSEAAWETKFKLLSSHVTENLRGLKRDC